jgi:hypothetical protein
VVEWLMAGLKVYDGSIWRATGVEDSQWDVLTATSETSSVELSWPSAGNSPSSYEVGIDDNIINVGNVNSYSSTGLIVGNSYNFKVRPVYSDGSTGGWSYFKNRGPTGFNSATGGSVTTVSNYNGTGETWKVHTFTGSGTLSVTSAPLEFNILVVNGGTGGGDANCSRGYPGGSGGNMRVFTGISIPTGSIPIVVGAGSSRGAYPRPAGGSSSVNTTLTTAGGLTGGGGGNSGNLPGGYNGSNGNYANTSGTNVRYGGGGGGGADGAFAGNRCSAGGSGGGGRGGAAGGDCGTPYGANGTPNTGGGGGGAGKECSYTPIGGNGGSGIVIVSYRIG